MSISFVCLLYVLLISFLKTFPKVFQKTKIVMGYFIPDNVVRISAGGFIIERLDYKPE